MTDVKAILCCGSTEDMCKDISWKVEETDKGICICLTGDNPERVKGLKAKFKSCCGQGESASSC